MRKTRILMSLVVIGLSLVASAMSSQAQEKDSPDPVKQSPKENGEGKSDSKTDQPAENVPKKLKPARDESGTGDSEQPKKRDKNQKQPSEFEKRPSKPQADDRPHNEPAMQRIHHLHIAIQNLKAAGMHDLAKEAAQRAEAMENELREMHEQRALKEAGRRGDELNELRHEVRQLHEALNEIRKALKTAQPPFKQQQPVEPGDFKLPAGKI
ncbi:MAG: hypothetical protein WCJ09_02220 [Planctomycetota bacterium]